MSEELPPGWASLPLGKLGTWRGGGTPSKRVREYWENGVVHWVSPKDMKRLLIDSAQDQITKRAVEESATNLVPADSVLMVTRSGILEHSFPVAVNTVAVTLNQDMKAVTPHSGIDPMYTAYYLKARAQNILDACSKDGTTVSSIDTDALTAYKIALAPQAEQKRIVSKIDELFSRIDEGERALEQVSKLVERYRQSVLKAAVTGELTRNWREARKAAGHPVESGEALLTRILTARRDAWELSELTKMKAKGITPKDDAWKNKYKEPVPPETTDLPELPEGWAWASVDQLCVEFGNGLSRKPANEPPGDPILRISAVRALSVDTSDVRYYVPEDGESLENFYTQRGDLLFTRYNGSRELVGVSGVVKRTERVLHPDKLIKARLAAPDLIGPNFLAIAMNSGASWAHITSCVKTSAGQHGIAGSDIKRAPVPIPPTDEQIRIVDLFEIADGKCNEAKVSCDTEMRRSNMARQAVLKAAFLGKLVSQEPGDEPASILLERVASGRTESKPATFMAGRKKKSA